MTITSNNRRILAIVHIVTIRRAAVVIYIICVDIVDCHPIPTNVGGSDRATGVRYSQETKLNITFAFGTFLLPVAKSFTVITNIAMPGSGSPGSIAAHVAVK